MPAAAGDPWRAAHADGYDAIADWFDAGRAASAIGCDHLARAIASTPRRALALDAGCGAGAPLGTMLRRAFGRVVGLDASPALLRLAHAHVSATTCGDLAAPPVAGGFDLVLAWDSLFHVALAAHAAAVTALADLVAPGGTLLMTAGDVPGDDEIAGEMRGVAFRYAALARDRYVALLEARGLRIAELVADQERHLVLRAARPE